MSNLLSDFKKFVMQGDLVAIAVAFIIGLAVKALIDSFVEDIFMGTIGLLVKCKDIVELFDLVPPYTEVEIRG